MVRLNVTVYITPGCYPDTLGLGEIAGIGGNAVVWGCAFSGVQRQSPWSALLCCL